MASDELSPTLSHLTQGSSTGGHVHVSGKTRLLAWELDFSQFKPFPQATSFPCLYIYSRNIWQVPTMGQAPRD